jgi:hypothetical protein
LASSGLRCAGPPSAKVGNVHAVSQSHFALKDERALAAERQEKNHKGEGETSDT